MKYLLSIEHPAQHLVALTTLTASIQHHELTIIKVRGRISDPHSFHADPDPDPGFEKFADADPVPGCEKFADPDPGLHF